ncbi:amino acid transporter [Pseudonocardia eucalypti]|uniref:amino acid permease n=1 Tax=Pseudonocardia eucalypti TaxID=648755 RepID=UPI00161D7EAF|nr:amino acid transporter [Pseudonocardia eucalypti]
MATDPSAAPEEDRRLHRALGTVSLTAMTLSSVIGSGWLFAAYNAAKVAGPAALLSWVITGVATLLVSLVFIDLAFRWPVTGGNVRWPQLASGPMVGAVVGWAVFLQAVYAGPSEATALMQYAGRWIPGLVEHETLTVPGRIFAVAVLGLFFFVNMFGVRLVARVNNVVTAIKIAVPALTVVLLLASGFDTTNYEVGGGFAPYGLSAALTAVVGSGLVYSFTGINAAAVLSGEAADARRTVPRATLIALGFSFALYLGLQLAMLFTLPTGMLGSGWHGINLNSPLAELASLVGMVWLSWLLLADAVFSPAGSMLVSAGVKGRYSYGAAQNGILPRFFASVHAGSGIPRRALLLNLSAGAVIILAFGSWKSIASSLSFYYGLSYAAVSIAVSVLYATAPDRGWLGRWSQPVAFSSFVLSGLILYWSTWTKVRVAIPLLLVGYLIYLWRARRSGHRGGMWMICLLLALTGLSYLGSFGGVGFLPAPVDSILVALACGLGWWFGLRSGIVWRRDADSTTDRPNPNSQLERTR